jgi:geranylgeranyl diphosphate synthase type II
MASAEAVGGAALDALDAGCAAELVHCFSLIHDDLPAIDDDDLRRGRPTCHKVYGDALAILAGDALFALAFQVASDVAAPAERVRRVTSCLAHATGSQGLVGGEVLDIEGEGRAPDEAAIEVIHERKTGALIAACCLMGGVLGGGTGDQCAALEAYGRKLGLAFQIADDLLNATSTTEALGKAAGSDREHGKQTYPLLMGNERAARAAHARALSALTDIELLPGDTRGLVELARFSVERES